jgi:hypothetical protein
VDYKQFAFEAVRVFDNNYVWEHDPFRDIPMPLHKRKTGGITAGVWDRSLVSADITDLFDCLQVMDASPRQPILALPVGCPYVTGRAKVEHIGELNTGLNGGHAVLYDGDDPQPLRAAAALHIRW